MISKKTEKTIETKKINLAEKDNITLNIEDNSNIDIITKDNSENTIAIIIQNQIETKKDEIINIKESKETDITKEIKLKINLTTGKNSKLNYYELNISDEKTKCTIEKTIELKDNSKFNLYEIALGGNESIIKTKTNIIGKNAESTEKFASITDKNSKIRTELTVEHINESSKSNIIARMIAMDESTCIGEGLIIVREKAKKTSGFQKLDGITLSKNAKINLNPKLNIKNNDVKCSHSASVSRFDDDKKFYLKTRGISEKLAMEMLVKSFISEITDEIKDANLIEIIDKKISEKLNADK